MTGAFTEDSAGRLMSPEVASLRAGMTAAEALERLRRVGHSAETIYALPVTDDRRRLLGMLGPVVDVAEQCVLKRDFAPGLLEPTLTCP